MPHPAPSVLALHCLLRLVCLNTKSNYGKLEKCQTWWKAFLDILIVNLLTFMTTNSLIPEVAIDYCYFSFVETIKCYAKK